MFLLASLIQVSLAASGKVTGYIDGVFPIGGVPHIIGWACDSQQAVSIDVHVYADGVAGKGTKLLQGKANSDSTAAISSRCGTSKISHKFFLPLSPELIKAHANKSLYVHGISVSGGSNLALTNSGSFKVPGSTQQIVKGYIDNILFSKNKTSVPKTLDRVISGWACDLGTSAPLEVHLYVGAPAGRGGIFVKKVLANIDAGSTSGVAQNCGFTNGAHRFEMILNEVEVDTFAGRSLFLHGVSKSKSGLNAPITRSGEIIFPPARVYVDSVAKLVNALNKAKNTGGIIAVKNGKYALTEHLIIGANTALYLEPSAEFIRKDVGGLLINRSEATGYNGPGNFAVVGGIWNGAAMTLGHAEHVLIREVTFKDTRAAHAIEMAALKNVVIENSKFMGVVGLSSADQYKEAIQIDGDSKESMGWGARNGTPNLNLVFRGNYFGGYSPVSQVWPSGIGSHNAIHDKYQQGIHIEGNTFEAQIYAGVRPYKWVNTRVVNNKFINCNRAVLANSVSWDSIDAQTASGVSTKISQAGSQFTFQGNTISGTKAYAVSFYGIPGNGTSGTSARWSDVKIISNSFINSSESIIRLDNVDKFQIANNTLKSILATKAGVLSSNTNLGSITTNIFQGGVNGGVNANPAHNLNLTVRDNTWSK